ncbi:hypothetical protein [Prosthecobacter sp.]|uniref:hypothetical protein n=1 Tax=Prosthecobacter sp. TaxID=1965333 RepID=UPI003783B462
MNDIADTSEKYSPSRVFRKVMKGLLFVILSLFVLGFFEFFYRLAFGWAHYLSQVIPQTQINVELLLCSLAALLLGMLGLQSLMSRLRSSGRWHWRYTFAWCAILILMFSTSIAAVGIVHQTGWLFRLPVWYDMNMGRQMKAVSNTKQVVLCAQQYAKYHDGRLPDTIADMIPEIISDTRIFWASVDYAMPPEPLVYAGAGLHDNDAATLPIVWSAHASASGKRVVATLDGSAFVITEEKFQAMLATLREHLAKSQRSMQQH